MIPPDDFFGKPWRAWLDDENVHRRKNEIYRSMIKDHVRPTKLVNLFMLTGGHIITGASAVAAHAVIAHLGLNPITVKCEMSIMDKITWMNWFKDPGIVFEDMPEAAAYFKEKTRWTVCRVL